MKRSQENKLNQFFNLRPGESSLVRQLFFHNFFQGVGIAFFFTAANTLFLEFFSVKWLPWVYLVSAVLLFIFGRAYAYFEHHWPIKKLMTFVVAVLAITPLLFYTGLATWQKAGLIFFLMAFHRVLYTLNSLEFWGLSALAFNVRQSKRIFPLIGAGDIPAKLLGYLAVTAIVPYTGIEALLLIASAAFTISYFFVRQLTKYHREAFQHNDSTPDFSPGFQQPKRWLPASMFRSPFILWLSLLSVVSLISLTLLDFAFLAEVKYNFKEKESLARFFGLLFSLGYTLILTSKFIISGRVIEGLGVVRATFILPVFLCLASLVAVITGLLTSDPVALLWVYSAILIGVEIIRYAIDDPNLMTLFQPLSRSLRLHGHTLVKTLMNPLGLLLTGGILLLILQFSYKINLTFISAVLLLFSLVMTFLAFRVRTHYLDQLFHAVRTRYFEGSDLSRMSPKAINILEDKLHKGSESEAIHSLKILLHQQSERKKDLITTAIQHQSDQVRSFALGLSIENQIELCKDDLIALVKTEKSPLVLQSAMAALPALAPDQLDLLYDFIESPDEDIRATAISTLLTSEQLEAETKAGRLVLDLIHSESVDEKAFACKLLQKINKKNNYYLILPLLQSQQNQVKVEAIKTAANIQHPLLHTALFRIFDAKPYTPHILSTLTAYKNKNIPPIQERLSEESPHFERDYQLCTLLAGIKTPESLELLFRQLKHPIAEIRGLAIRLLYQTQFSLPKHLSTDFATYCDSWLADAYKLVIAENKYEKQVLLQSTFTQERKSKTNELLMLLSLNFSRPKLNRIMDSLASGNANQQAKALETLEYEIPKSIFFPLELLIDRTLGETRLRQILKLNAHYQLDEDILENVVRLHWRTYSRWTTAIVLRYFRLKNEGEPLSLQHLSQHPAILIREQAQINQTTPVMHSEPQAEQKLLQIEKILLLKNTKLFQNIPEHILVDVADIVREVEYAAGERLFLKGDLGNKMYVIAGGKIRIHDGDHTFSVLDKHEIFGELALLSPKPRSASATASEDSLLLCLDQAPFYELISSHPEVTKGIIQRLAELLRNQNEEIVDMKQQLKEATP